MQEASLHIQQGKIKSPENLAWVYMENYRDFFTQLIEEDEKKTEAYFLISKKRISALQTADKTNPYRLYATAVIHFHNGILYARKSSYLKAFQQFKAGLQDLELNQKKFPDFMLNAFPFSVVQVTVGAIPDSYRWCVELLGFPSGNMEGGLQNLSSCIQQLRATKNLFTPECEAVYAFLQLQLNNQPELAWNHIQESSLDASQGSLAGVVMTLIAMKSGKNKEALEYVQQIPQGEHYLTFPYIHFLHGKILLQQLHPDAKKYFELFLRSNTHPHHIREAYWFLAWDAILHQQSKEFQSYIQLLKTKGNNASGSDHQAWKEAHRGYPPHPILIKARLLFDGGYYDAAWNQCQLLAAQISKKTLLPQYIVELNYRKGRILHAQNKWKSSEVYYSAAYEKGKSLPEFFAISSAVHLGEIFEKQGFTQKAITWYQIARKMESQEYQDDMHVKAKAGLNRLKL